MKIKRKDEKGRPVLMQPKEAESTIRNPRFEICLTQTDKSYKPDKNVNTREIGENRILEKKDGMTNI